MLDEAKKNWPILLMMTFCFLLFASLGSCKGSSELMDDKELMMLDIELKKLQIEKLKREIESI